VKREVFLRKMSLREKKKAKKKPLHSKESIEAFVAVWLLLLYLNIV
jgi:hypothetical protein